MSGPIELSYVVLPGASDPYQDRRTWGDGPWQDEPDLIRWTDVVTGYPCIMKRSWASGAWCGYVAVGPGHPYHGRHYDDVPVDVHGGLTYGAACQDEDASGLAICHVPEPGQPAEVFWFGFDTAHCWDVAPRMAAFMRHYGMFHSADALGESYRDVAYVRAEVERLAAQLAELQEARDVGAD